MDIRISPTPVPMPTFALTIEVRLMHGDADGYSNIVLGPFDYRSQKGKDDLAAAVRMLEALKDLDAEHYLDVPGFEDYDDDWDRDTRYADSDRGGEPATLEEYQVFYYDAQGVKYPAKVYL